MENANLKKGFIFVLLLATGCIQGAANSDVNKALLSAIMAGDINKTQKCLLNKDANINAQDDDNCTLLYTAIVHGHIGVAKLLIENKANVNIKGFCGRAPLHIASSYSDTCEAELLFALLIGSGANVNAQDNDNCTPLYIASAYENIQLINPLLLAAANRSLQSNKGVTASELAKEKGYNNIVTLIDDFPDNVAVFSLKQAIINLINKNQNNEIKVPSVYPKLLLQVDSDALFRKWSNYQAVRAKNELKKDDKK